jgi:hypothetical protein
VAIKAAKKDWREKWGALRQRFILTREEKQVIVFVVAAFALGLSAKCYRDGHRPATPVKIDKQHSHTRGR